MPAVPPALAEPWRGETVGEVGEVRLGEVRVGEVGEGLDSVCGAFGSGRAGAE